MIKKVFLSALFYQLLIIFPGYNQPRLHIKLIYEGKEVYTKKGIRLSRDQYFQVLNTSGMPVKNVTIMIINGQRPCYISEYKDSSASLPIPVNPILTSQCLSKRKVITINVESKIFFNIPVIE